MSSTGAHVTANTMVELMSIPANASIVEGNQSSLQINTMMAKENGVLFLGSGKTGLLLICSPNPCFYLQNELIKKPKKPPKEPVCWLVIFLDP